MEQPSKQEEEEEDDDGEAADRSPQCRCQRTNHCSRRKRHDDCTSGSPPLTLSPTLMPNIYTTLFHLALLCSLRVQLITITSSSPRTSTTSHTHMSTAQSPTQPTPPNRTLPPLSHAPSRDSPPSPGIASPLPRPVPSRRPSSGPSGPHLRHTLSPKTWASNKLHLCNLSITSNLSLCTTSSIKTTPVMAHPRPSDGQ